ncbi:hypothetical protein [Microlunatus speluncae]|uniref:hypothetical protein n=1 Tax=Microlunatus speluncae TaxID=2594267 RepID=UPI0012665849|nr:hypothetical protein [Microlunatus speluncae]
MDTKTLIIQNKINTRVDLASRASVALLGRRPVTGSELPTGPALLCVADFGADMAVPTQPCVSCDPRPVMVPAPQRQNRIEGSVEGHQGPGTTTHQKSARGKAATKFSTRLGRRTCSPPV